MRHPRTWQRTAIKMGVILCLLLAAVIRPAAAQTTTTAAPGNELWAWGGNWSGQFGNGSVENRPTPIPLTHTSGVVAFGAGSAHTVVLKHDGTVLAWGYNRNGELANPITDTCVAPDAARPCSKVPVQVPGLNDVVAIDVGAYHTLALKRDDTLWGWGFNGYGALGSITGEICSAGVMCSSAPVQVPGISDVIAFAAGHAHSLALKRDGTVWSWGANYYGQLGRPSTSTCQFGLPCDPTPVPIEGLSDIVAIVAGKGDRADHSFAIGRDGAVWAWGMNDHGQLGVSTTDSCSVYGVGYSCSTRPVRVSGLSGVTALVVGAFHSLALTNDGTVWSWGDNAYGQLGRGSAASDPTPLPVSGLAGVAQIAAGTVFSLARTHDGTVGPGVITPTGSWAMIASRRGTHRCRYTS